MLALSVREALRQAAAAFGPPGTSVDLPSPATPEAVFWAIERARAAGTDHVVRGIPGVVPERPDPAAPVAAPAVRAGRPHPGGGLRCIGSRPSSCSGPSAAPGCWSPSSRSAATRPARPGPRWWWRPTRRGGASAVATSRRPRSAGPAPCSQAPPAEPEQLVVGLNGQGPHRARPPVLRRRGHPAARAAARRARRRDLRRRPRGPRAGPDPGPARPGPAPRRLPRRPAAPERGWPAWTTPRRAWWSTTRRCPRSPWARCPRAPTSW